MITVAWHYGSMEDIVTAVIAEVFLILLFASKFCKMLDTTENKA